MTKHIFVTGGVASSLGKGITASSLGRLLKARGLRVTMQKLDPYINVDPGTMNPFEHGAVFVTNDGAETDLDIGHYERFLDVDLDGVAEELAAALGRDHRGVDRPGGDVGVAVQVLVDEPLVVPQVEISLAAIVGDEDLTVLERVHRSRVDVDVRIQLLHGHAQAARFQQTTE